MQQSAIDFLRGDQADREKKVQELLDNTERELIILSNKQAKGNIMNTVSDEVFDELKREAIKIWKTYDNTYGYADEKIGYLESFGNVSDNFGTIIGMFDIHNQRKLYDAVSSTEAREAIDYWCGGSLEQSEINAAQMGLL